MKKLRVLLILILFLVAITAEAQEDFETDFDDFGDFGNLNTPSTSSSSASSSPFSFSGSGGLDTRFWINTDKGYKTFWALGENTAMSIDPFFKFNIAYSGTYGEIEAKVKLNYQSLLNTQWDILDELTARLYLKDFVFEAGKMKLVWGKGDKLHVLDNFNANDYTDFIIPDYIDRRIAEPMLHIVYNAPIKENLRIEAAWTPIMTPTRFSADTWKPYKVSKIEKSVRQYYESLVASSFTNYTQASVLSSKLSALGALAQGGDSTAAATYQALMSQYGFTSPEEIAANLTTAGSTYMKTLSRANDFDSSDLYEDIYNLSFGQLGARITWTLGRVDLGASYYYGHYKEPNAKGKIRQGAGGGAEFVVDKLKYDKVNIFGLELATILWKFNIRAEVAYNMTDDYAGDNPFTHNNSIAYLAGFDIDLPFSNFNLNVQETGVALLKVDGIDEKFDADYDSGSHYTHNKFAFQLSDSYLHDKLKWEALVIWGIENCEVAVIPKIEYNIKGGFYLTLKALYLHCSDKDGEFYNFTAYSSGGKDKTHDRGFIQIGARYDF